MTNRKTIILLCAILSLRAFLYSSEIQPPDSVQGMEGESVKSISYIFSNEFRQRYSYINDTLVYKL